MSNLPEIIKDRGVTQAEWSALSTSLYPGAAENSIAMVWDYCKARKLDPLKKVVHIVPMSVKVGNDYVTRDVIMPGIAELRTTASRTGSYAGQDLPVYGEEIDFLGVKAPLKCSVTVYRIVQGVRVGFTHEERFSEAVGIKKGWNGAKDSVNTMWTKRPYAQLAKCAEAGALRKAFPEELGSTYVPEEMHGQVVDMGEAEQVEEDLMPKAKTEPPVQQNEEKPEQDDFVKDYEKAEVETQPAKPEPAEDLPAIKAGPLKLLKAKLTAAGKSEDDLCKHFRISTIEALPMVKINEALEWSSQ